ncbi:hypothetical protein D038_0700B, partial [Vibrio parahaemolyticus IDH02189]
AVGITFRYINGKTRHEGRCS